MGIVLFITTALLYLSHTQHLFVLDLLSKEERDKSAMIYQESIRAMEEKYRLVGEHFLINPAVIDAVKRKDRKALLSLSQSVYDKLRDDNPYFEIMHFHTHDTKSLLRLHRPDHFGDDLKELRPIIRMVNELGKPLFGLEIGKYGISHRIALPVIEPKSKEVLGVLEMGINAEYIISYLKKHFDIDSTLVLDRAALHTYFAHTNSSDRFNHLKEKVIYRSSADNLITYENLDAVLSTACQMQEIQHQDMLVINGVTLHTFEGQPVGNMILFKNMEFYTEKVQTIRILNVVLGILLVGLSFIIIHLSYQSFSRQLKVFNERLLHKNRSLTKLSSMDHLTKIYNRRKIEELLLQEYRASKRYETPLSLILFDVDHFKLINDTLGHHIGDKVLRSLSKLVTHSIRDTDHFGRWGGEEFMLVVPHTDEERAMVIAEKLRLLIAHHDFEEAERVTCSFGIRQFKADDAIKDAVKFTDDALYKAKEEGRNRVVASKD